MQYEGNIYGKVAGKYIPLTQNTEYYDKITDENTNLTKEIEMLNKKYLEATEQFLQTSKLLRNKEEENELLRQEVDQLRYIMRTEMYNSGFVPRLKEMIKETK